MWIQSHNTLRTHPKLFRLMRLMGWDTSQAIGTLLMFWWWCLNYAPDGDLRRYDAAETAELSSFREKKRINSSKR